MLDSTVVCRRALGCEWGGEVRSPTGNQERLHEIAISESEIAARMQFGETSLHGQLGISAISPAQSPARSRAQTAGTPGGSRHKGSARLEQI